MPIDKFALNDIATQAPATTGFTITPSNSTIFAQYTRAIYIGGDGNIAVRLSDMETSHVDFIGVKAGTILPIRARMVRATDTTATNIVGLY